MVSGGKGFWPTTCSDVTIDLADEHYGEPWYENTAVGDLLWNPKGGEGHVLLAEEPCNQMHRDRTKPSRDCGCGGWFGPCNSTTWVCECGEDNAWRDHHYDLLARRGVSW